MKKMGITLVLMLVLALALALPLGAENESTVLQAEDGALTGAATVMDDAQAEGGKAILLGGKDAQGEYKVSIPADDTYRIILTYRAEDRAEGVSCGLRLAVDGKAYAMVTESYSVYTHTWLVVPLEAGEHTLTLLAPANYDGSAVKGCRVDQIEVIAEKNVPPVGSDNPPSGQVPNPDTADRDFALIAALVLIPTSVICAAVAVSRTGKKA